MRLEIKSAANFLTNLLRIKSENNVHSMNLQQLEQFCGKLEDMLCHHYQKHWFPEKPFKGSGYRCIRINHKMDPIISRAGSECGFDEERLRNLFPDELTMWIDPKEVSYRIGENGSICVLFDGAAKCHLTTEKRDRTPSRSLAISVNRNNKKSTNNNNGSPPDTPPSNIIYDRFPMSTCKESMRNNSSWDSFVMDPRNMNLEQYTPYVSS